MQGVSQTIFHVKSNENKGLSDGKIHAPEIDVETLTTPKIKI